MRNVSIWEYDGSDLASPSLPLIVRMFVYKGNKNTLNQFLSPAYVYRDKHLAPRSKDLVGFCTPFDLKMKGQVVIMSYMSHDSMAQGIGNPLVVLNTYDQAIHWLVKNCYDFYGEESATKRCRKIKVEDFDARQAEFVRIAIQVEKQLQKSIEVYDVDATPLMNALKEIDPSLVMTESEFRRSGIQQDKTFKLPEVSRPPIPPTPPKSRIERDDDSLAKSVRNGVDNSDLNAAIRTLANKNRDQRKKKPNFFERLMGFCKLFNK